MIKQAIKLGVATAMSLSLMGGMAFASTNNHHKDPGSKNANICIQTNKNNVFVGNLNVQGAKSGNATVGGGSKNKWVKKDMDTGGNTTGGSATSGDATNDNSTTTDVTVSNASDPCCTCLTNPTDGLQTDNKVKSSGGDSTLNLQVTTNTNNVFVANVSLQGAKSGNATVSGNTNGGSATSGDASNSNSTSQTVTVSNN